MGKVCSKHGRGVKCIWVIGGKARGKVPVRKTKTWVCG
jgi:hypothetical protein